MCLAVNVWVSEIHLYLHYCCDRRQTRRDKSSRFIAYYVLRKSAAQRIYDSLNCYYDDYHFSCISNPSLWNTIDGRASRGMRPANRACMSHQWRTAKHTCRGFVFSPSELFACVQHVQCGWSTLRFRIYITLAFGRCVRTIFTFQWNMVSSSA